MDIQISPNLTQKQTEILKLPASGCVAIGHMVAAGKRVLLLKHSETTVGIDVDQAIPSRSWIDRVNGPAKIEDVKFYRIKSIELEEL